MPEILHESKGLTIKRNDKNKVVVVTLFFYADPLKAKPEWIKTASIGMSKADVKKEYYIDYTAQQGERIFPQMSSFKERIVLKRESYPPPESIRKYWAGFDYGTRRPSAFIVFGEGKNHQGEPALFALWEHYEPTKNLSALCDTICNSGYYDKLSWIAADPSINFKNQQTQTGLTSIGDQMYEHGVRKLVPGLRDEESFISYIHMCWADLEEGSSSKFYILDRCPNLIREMENIVYASQSDASLKSQGLKETMVNRDNHAIDATKYFINSYPGVPKTLKIDRDTGLSEIEKKPLWVRHIK